MQECTLLNCLTKVRTPLQNFWKKHQGHHPMVFNHSLTITWLYITSAVFMFFAKRVTAKNIDECLSKPVCLWGGNQTKNARLRSAKERRWSCTKLKKKLLWGVKKKIKRRSNLATNVLSIGELSSITCKSYNCTYYVVPQLVHLWYCRNLKLLEIICNCILKTQSYHLVNVNG
jgi:hypothetical protein